MAFTFDWLDRRLRIKPSIEYLREKTTVTGEIRVAQVVRVGGFNPVPTPATNASFRFLQLDGQESKWFNGLGPGLELDMDAARAGGFMISVFGSFQSYRWLGNRKLDVEPGDLLVSYSGPAIDNGFDPSTVDNDEVAKWSYEKEKWGFQGGVGLRFRWQPE